jgi:hypothetical protein
LVADNLDDSYVQYLSYGASARAGISQDIGADFAAGGFARWEERAPGFNVRSIQTPLRMERDSHGVMTGLGSWEIYVQLKYLRKPTELYYVPDVEHGAHQLTRADQLLASQEGAVDWFDFWLNGHEDADPAKAMQYARWEKLCELQIAEKTGLPTFCVSASEARH